MSQASLKRPFFLDTEQKLTVKVSNNLEKWSQLLGVGFDNVCDLDRLKVCRKQKNGL